MAAGQDAETSRTAVSTYVPEAQKAEWEDHAERLDMTMSEFVRVMVQAGRRGFDDVAADLRSESPEGARSDVTDRDLEAEILDALSDSEYTPWDELREAVVGELENELDSTLNDLIQSGRIEYRPSSNEYILNGEPR